MNTFYHGDCLFVMEHDIQPESVDLIYLDPPFFTGKVQKGVAKWQPNAMEVSYEDSKKFWGDSHKVNNMREHAPEWLKHIAVQRPDFASYLYYMMARLKACHKVLKHTGSIYLHCDWRASHYLKMIMDDVFEFYNYQNDIVWHYGLGGSSAERWSRKFDTILFYSKSSEYKFTPFMVKATSQRMKGLNKKCDNVWEIPTLNNMSRERQGYPTQKPLALLKRIINASSNEGDVVLDPFCGCGTAIIAAQQLNRQWIGIDISKDAYDISSKRHGELPLEFTHINYVSRDINEVKSLNPHDFEKWVNEYYKATKPSPDKGVDGVTHDGIPIQTKTFEVSRKWVDEFNSSIKYHPAVKQPVNNGIIVSSVGFDESAKKRQFEIKANDKVDIEFITPELMIGG